MKKKIVLGVSIIIIFCIGLLSSPANYAEYLYNNEEPTSCTNFTISIDGEVYFCNNEDYYPRNTRLRFIPGMGTDYDIALFGNFINNNALLVMGGINEFGLSFDTNVLGWSNINDDPDKLDYNSWFEIEMLRVCKTINEVISWIANKNLIGLTVRQTHIADKTGDAVVLALDSNGELNISRISGNYLLATNWNLAKNTIADIQAGCWRYNRSDLLLSTIASKDDVDINFCRDVLNASHQPKDSKVNNNLLFGGSGIHTLYSNINDLTNMMMYIYSFSDFNRQGILNLTEEFAKGPHSISLEALVSQQHQPSPMATIINLMAYLVTGITIIGLSLLVIYELKIKDNNNIKNRNLTKETEKKSDGN